ncbi:MAG: Rne/Rng family ribonuclease [Parvularculaceae bacterium]
MSKKMLIDAAHPEEIRVAVLDHGKVEDFDFESAARKPLRGNIYLARVTRVEPSLQAAFVEYGGNRHGFLAFSEIHPDYYQIPVSDRQALQKAEAEVAELADLLDVGQPGDEDEDDDDARGIAGDEVKTRRRRRRDENGAAAAADDGQSVSEESSETETAAEANGAAADDHAHDDHAHDDAGDDEEEVKAVSGGDDDPVDEIDPVSDDEQEEEEEEEDGEEDDAETEEDDGDDEEEAAARAASDDEEDEDGDAEEAAAADAEDAGDEDGDETVDDEFDENAPPARVRPTGKEREALFERYKEAKRRRSHLLRNYKIQEVIKRRQILLVQVVKEERGNKGAALTTYMSLAGRYCVLMPNTARGGGISRKIPQSTDRRRLRRVVDDLDVPKGMGLIIRTAGAKRTKTEIKRDYDYLIRLWENIRTLTLNSIAPCLIYEEASLIKRAIRDLYDKDIGEVLVEGDAGYREAKDFMKMLMPSHAKFVQPHKDAAPIFLKHGVEQQLDGMYQPTVRLKSGGYIVIHQTEALVAIDVNSGRATRERNIEQTAVKTNIEAAYEAARQMRLRDLAGLIVLDFIDMEEQKNNRKVEKALKDAIKHDRARIQLGRISNFGLMEMSRQRRRSGIVDGTTQACPTCSGAGVIRSAEMAAIRILRAAEGEAVTGRAGIISIHASLDVTVYVLNHHRDWLKRIEDQHGVTVQLIPDTGRAGDDFAMEKSGVPRERAPQTFIRADQAETMDAEPVEEETAEEETPEAEAAEERDGERRRGRRRRRRGRKDGPRDGSRDGERDGSGDQRREAAPEAADEEPSEEEEPAAAEAAEGGATETSEEEQARRRRRRGRRGGRRNRRNRDGTEIQGEDAQGEGAEMSAGNGEDDASADADDTAESQAPEPVANGHDHEPEPAQAEEEQPGAAAPAPAEEAPQPYADLANTPQPAADKPRKTGWWRRGA